jgi:acetyltransferase-like isoleucine patch superfamily enzyme
MIQFLRKAVRSLYQPLFFVFFGLFFKRLHTSDYISPFAYIRKRHRLALGGECLIQRNVTIWGDVGLGKGVQLGPGVCIYGKVQIGADCMIAPNVVIAAGGHGYNTRTIPMIRQEAPMRGIVIGCDVWVGANAVVLDGVTIGEGAVIGALSVVTSDVEPYAIMVGNPARKLRERPL